MRRGDTAAEEYDKQPCYACERHKPELDGKCEIDIVRVRHEFVRYQSRRIKRMEDRIELPRTDTGEWKIVQHG